MLNTALIPLSRVANGIAIAANIAGTLVVLALVVVVNFDVVARGVFNAPFLGAVEVVQFSMVLIVFLQLPDVVRVDRLTRSDGFLLFIGKRNPKLAQWIRRAINVLAALFMGIVAYAMYPEFTEMWHTKDYFGIPGVFTAPWWPIKLVILLSAGLCTILFVLKVLLPAQPPKPTDLPASEDTPE
ncbi:MAG: TRAP transporter small permease subunit [Paracoccaceae bacterium]